MIFMIAMNSNGLGTAAIDNGIFFAVILVELLGWVYSRTLFRHLFRIPVDLEMLQARWGVWVMLVIGEAVIQVVEKTQHTEDSETYSTLIFISLIIVILYSLAMQYFDSCQVEWFHHALTKSAVAGVSWVWLHVPLTFVLFRLGIVFNTMVLDCSVGKDISREDAFLLSILMSLETVFVTLIRMCNSLEFDDASKYPFHLVPNVPAQTTFVLRTVFAGVQLSVSEWDVVDPIFLVLCHVCILFFITGVDVVKDIFDNHQHKEDSDDDESVDGNTKLPSRSLPRQWSNLQLVRTDSSLAKNSSHIEIVDHTTMRTPIEKKKSIQEVAAIDGRETFTPVEQEFQPSLRNETLATASSSHPENPSNHPIALFPVGVKSPASFVARTTSNEGVKSRCKVQILSDDGLEILDLTDIIQNQIRISQRVTHFDGLLLMSSRTASKRSRRHSARTSRGVASAAVADEVSAVEQISSAGDGSILSARNEPQIARGTLSTQPSSPSRLFDIKLNQNQVHVEEIGDVCDPTDHNILLNTSEVDAISAI